MKYLLLGGLIILYTISLCSAQKCFQEECIVDGEPGCKVRLKHRINNTQECCKHGSARGYADTFIRVGNTPDCFMCDRCVDILTTIDGEWSDWSRLSVCSKTCGDGIRFKRRQCDSPPPSKLGKPCKGESIQKRACNEKPCPVDGGWGPWSEKSVCSTSCGQGTSFQTRECNNPRPSFGGRPCKGSEERSLKCVLIENCPIDGGWTDWTDWSDCSKLCGGGQKRKTRSCNNPTPQLNGKPCEGESIQKRRCNEEPCPVDGGWGPWSEKSVCSTSCGQGTSFQTRVCNNPRPALGGRPCRGSEKRSLKCVLIENCPIDGGWTDWTDWSDCSKLCGGGEKRKTRSCNNPTPQFNGKPCVGYRVQMMNCNIHPCPIDGQWSEWSAQSPCIYHDCKDPTKGGYETRSRSCTNPAPKYGGKMCPGQFFQTAFCTEGDNCPSDGEWDTWDRWQCSATGAVRTRQCLFRTKFRGKDCQGNRREAIPMHNTDFCNICRPHCKLNHEGKLVPASSIDSGVGTGTGTSDEDGSVSGFGSGDGYADDTERESEADSFPSRGTYYTPQLIPRK